MSSQTFEKKFTEFINKFETTKDNFVKTIRTFLTTIETLNINLEYISEKKNIKTLVTEALFIFINNNSNILKYMEFKLLYTIYNKTKELREQVSIERKDNFEKIMEETRQYCITAMIDIINIKINMLSIHIKENISSDKKFITDGLNSIMYDINSYLPNEYITNENIVNFKQCSDLAKSLDYDLLSYKQTRLLKYNDIIEEYRQDIINKMNNNIKELEILSKKIKST